MLPLAGNTLFRAAVPLCWRARQNTGWTKPCCHWLATPFSCCCAPCVGARDRTQDGLNRVATGWQHPFSCCRPLCWRARQNTGWTKPCCHWLATPFFVLLCPLCWRARQNTGWTKTVLPLAGNTLFVLLCPLCWRARQNTDGLNRVATGWQTCCCAPCVGARDRTQDGLKPWLSRLYPDVHNGTARSMCQGRQ